MLLKTQEIQTLSTLLTLEKSIDLPTSNSPFFSVWVAASPG